MIDRATEGAIEQRKQGLKRIRTIIEAIIWLTSNELPLRGHTDWGPIGEKVKAGEGLLRSVLRLMAKNGNKTALDIIEGKIYFL